MPSGRSEDGRTLGGKIPWVGTALGVSSSSPTYMESLALDPHNQLWRLTRLPPLYEEFEAQRGLVTCTGSHSRKRTEVAPGWFTSHHLQTADQISENLLGGTGWVGGEAGGRQMSISFGKG